jgi:hypothetical protein
MAGDIKGISADARANHQRHLCQIIDRAAGGANGRPSVVQTQSKFRLCYKQAYAWTMIEVNFRSRDRLDRLTLYKTHGESLQSSPRSAFQFRLP